LTKFQESWLLYSTISEKLKVGIYSSSSKVVYISYMQIRIR